MKDSYPAQKKQEHPRLDDRPSGRREEAGASGLCDCVEGKRSAGRFVYRNVRADYETNHQQPGSPIQASRMEIDGNYSFVLQRIATLVVFLVT